MKEEWRTVVIDSEVFEGYEVSNMGRVRSLDYRRTGKVKELRLMVSNRGYLQVGLQKNGKQKMCLVHRLVAYAFIPNDNPTEKTDINHINEIKTDNKVENLEWVTTKENNNYGTRTERQVKTRTSKTRRGKTRTSKTRTSKTRRGRSGNKVRCIETGIVYESIIDVERKLGLNHSNISKCCKGKYKTVGGYHWKYVD